MQRMTKRKFDGTGPSIEGSTWEAFEKLAQYEDAEESGLLLRLPCKLGDTVYYIDGGKSYKAKASAFRFNESGIRVYCERNYMGYVGFEGIYGKTVFFTHEEAEKALKGAKIDG